MTTEASSVRRRVILGAGPAGLNAALQLAELGYESTVIDENPSPGGAIFRRSSRRAEVPPAFRDRTYRRGQALLEKLEARRDKVEMILGAQVVGTFDGNRELSYLLDGVLRRLRFEQLFVCTGCYERAQPFPGWTLPGVMSVGGFQLQVKRGLVRPAGRVALVGTGPLLLVAAKQLHLAGVEVAGVFEAGRRSALAGQLPRLLAHPTLLAEGMRYMAYLRRAGIPVHYGWGIVEARGDGAVEEVVVAPYDAEWRPRRERARTLFVDGLGVGYGYVARSQVTQLLGCRHAYERDSGGLRPQTDAWRRTSLANVYAAGDCAGVFGSEAAELEGRVAALGALNEAGELRPALAKKLAAGTRRGLERLRRFRSAFDRFSALRPGLLELPGEDTLVCRCEKVDRGGLDAALARGVPSLPALKMSSRLGMGDCQGKMCCSFAGEYLARHRQCGPSEVGELRPRIPLVPIPFSALTGGES